MAGDQVPEIAFVDVVGKVGAALPAQIGASTANVGTIGAVTVCTIVVVNAH